MSNYLLLPGRVFGFTIWFIGQILQSSWIVLVDVLTPGPKSTPRVVRLPLQSRSDFHIASIGALITMTPGTLTLGVIEKTPDSCTLLVHSMYHSENAAAVSDLLDMEQRMLHAITLKGAR